MSTVNLWQIPVTTTPNQLISVSLPIDNTTLSLQLMFRYNTQALYWTMDIMNLSGQVYVSSIPLVPGVYPMANILQAYAYLNIGSAYIVPSGNNLSLDWPNDSDLGTDFTLWWSDTPGVNGTPIGIPASYKQYVY